MNIGDDSEFKAALSFLSGATRRLVAARFAENVLALCPDPRVKGAIESAKRTDISAAELATLFQSAKAASVDSYTQCGHECDWNDQASHFVAEAGLACVRPEQPGDTVEEGRFPRAVRTDDPVDLPFDDLHVDIVERTHGAERLA